MIVSENTPETEALRKHFNFLRGATILAFANAEFYMKHFLSETSKDERLSHLDGYSHRVEKLLKNFRTVLDSDVCSSLFEETPTYLIDAFERVIDDRNDFAHGLAKLDHEKKQVTMFRFKPIKGNPHNINDNIYDLSTLEEKVRVFDHLSSEIIKLIIHLALELKINLPSID